MGMHSITGMIHKLNLWDAARDIYKTQKKRKNLPDMFNTRSRVNDDRVRHLEN